MSSVGVYGQIDNPPADEDSPCRPDLLYERTKYEGELKVKEFFQETDFPIVIIRPSWVYGPHPEAWLAGRSQCWTLPFTDRTDLGFRAGS